MLGTKTGVLTTLLERLEGLEQLSGDNECLSPSDHGPKEVMSENMVNDALRAMGYDTKTEVCGHGFRTMAR